MASTDPPQNLAAILATLAAYAPPQPTPLLQQTPQNPYPSLEELEEGEYDPSTFIPSTHPPPQPSLQPEPQPPTPPAPYPTPTPRAPPPSTITTWPPALRHTTSLLSRNPSLLPRLKHLINTTHTHEKQWWAGRLALVQKINGREEGRRKLDEALASVGGLVAGGPGGFSASEMGGGEELALYDRKVHRACGEMVAATRGELGRLGIPFFGGGEGKVGEEELRVLQKRMVEFLEEFCQE